MGVGSGNGSGNGSDLIIDCTDAEDNAKCITCVNETSLIDKTSCVAQAFYIIFIADCGNVFTQNDLISMCEACLDYQINIATTY